MTKEEIYVKIGYCGKYTKDVKKKLRLLSKKYHPDLNHGDDSIMKLINEVKEEIEQEKISYHFSPKREKKKESSFQTDVKDNFSSITIDVLEKKLQQLILEREKISLKLKKIQHSIHLLFTHYNKKVLETEIKKIEIEEEMELDEKLGNQTFVLLGLFVGFFFFCLIFFTFSIFYKNILFFILFVLFGICCFISLRWAASSYRKKKENIESISRNYALKNQILKEVFQIKEKIKRQEKKRNDLSFQKQKCLNDIQFYRYEISKRNDKSFDYQNKKSNIYQKNR